MSDIYHRSLYNGAKIAAGREDLPEWEDLTEEQRQRIRETNIKHQRFMNDLGTSIREGTPPPDPLTS